MEQSTQELWQAAPAVQFLKSKLKIMPASRGAPKGRGNPLTTTFSERDSAEKMYKCLTSAI